MSTPQPAVPSRRRGLRLLVGGLIVSLVALAGGYYLYLWWRG